MLTKVMKWIAIAAGPLTLRARRQQRDDDFQCDGELFREALRLPEAI
jgi:hypothetical protein